MFLESKSYVFVDNKVDDDGNVIVQELEEENEENAYSREYDDNSYYVDEEGIVEAMEELGDNAEILFESPVSFEVSESDNIASYDSILRLVKNYGPDEEEEAKSYFIISTHEIPTLYKADVEKNIVPVVSNLYSKSYISVSNLTSGMVV